MWPDHTRKPLTHLRARYSFTGWVDVDFGTQLRSYGFHQQWWDLTHDFVRRGTAETIVLTEGPYIIFVIIRLLRMRRADKNFPIISRQLLFLKSICFTLKYKVL